VDINSYIFPNLMLIIQNLKVAPDAVQTLIGDHIDELITTMYLIPMEFNFFREGLLNVVLDLI